MSDSPSTGYERRDLNVRAVAWFFAGLTVTFIVIFVGLHYFLSAMGGAPSKPALPQISMAGPRLQAHPIADLKAWRTAQEAELNRCRWVDRHAGIIEIPIGRAMELTLQRGLPARKPAASQGGPP